MVIQGYDDFFKMYNKQNNKKVKDIVENIVEVLLLLVATFFLFKGIFMTARISNDTSLKQIVASEVTFFVSLVAILIIYICNRMNDACKKFYKKLCFDKIYKNRKLLDKIHEFNISGLIDVIQRRIDRREKMYKTARLIFTALVIPAAKAVYDTSNLQDVGLFILFINNVILAVFLAVVCGIGMHYPIRRETIALYEYLDFLTQYQSINEPTEKLKKNTLQ